MTDTYAEQILIEKFKTLKGLQIETTKDENGNDILSYPEIAFPNESFERPDNGYWYELYFLPTEPVQVELGSEARSRWSGVMQINICVPKNDGIVPLNSRYNNIASLFRSGSIIDGVRIRRTYRTSALDDGDYYVMPVSVEWQADLER